MGREPKKYRNPKNKTIMEDIAVMECPVLVTDMKKKLSDVLMAISWREFANT